MYGKKFAELKNKREINPHAELSQF
ncbi:hypothetical protein PI23P_08280 [Polaribacter irgensii 23-P]|uniref:Uncharacterized protein n=1 Tax=Polaribacter irgensii 23-P TaxID=313594 RepID=A4BZL5_9FLAO|nr:hypothetical protein PI23P_08280 [Polaribacter irgensii 23-P]